jgi:hypothetical protein
MTSGACLMPWRTTRVTTCNRADHFHLYPALNSAEACWLADPRRRMEESPAKTFGCATCGPHFTRREHLKRTANPLALLFSKLLAGLLERPHCILPFALCLNRRRGRPHPFPNLSLREARPCHSNLSCRTSSLALWRRWSLAFVCPSQQDSREGAFVCHIATRSLSICHAEGSFDACCSLRHFWGLPGVAFCGTRGPSEGGGRPRFSAPLVAFGPSSPAYGPARTLRAYFRL